jgi:hypothetical protein
MFISLFYKYNKWSCTLFCLFILAFLFINYKWGVVASPVTGFGMYSKKVYLTDTQAVYFIKANNKLVEADKLSINDRDVLQIFLERYEKHTNINAYVYNLMVNYFSAIGLKNAVNKDAFFNTIDSTVFKNWYVTKISRMVKEPVAKIEIYKQQFVWKQDRFTSIDTLQKLPFFAE